VGEEVREEKKGEEVRGGEVRAKNRGEERD
jgi:hypothetical protein